MTVKVACQSEVFDQQAARLFAATWLTQEVSAALGANYALVSQITTMLVGLTVTDTKGGTLALSIQAEGEWVSQWNLTRLQALAKRIAGARKQDALALLQSLEGVQAATRHLSGSERATLPADPSRIGITVGGG